MNVSSRWIHSAFVCGLLVMEPATLVADETIPVDQTSKIVARALDVLWPHHAEPVDMLADILIKGERISGGDGWFRKGIAQSRFDWSATCQTLDKNQDNSISRSEFHGTDADFTRLDRDRNGNLTAMDFDFSTQTLPPSPGAMFFGRADRDGDGKITREDLEAFFKANDSGSSGFLSLADFQSALTVTSPPPSLSSGPPTRATFLKSFVRGELGAFPAGPNLNDIAPDFTLGRVDGGDAISLSKVIGRKPVVLIFGNFTCGPFRAQAGNIEKLHNRYKDRATFLMVYVREPHPIDGWRMDNNDRVGVSVRQPRDYAERLEVARMCSGKLKLGFPMLVDTMDDAVNNGYSGIPSRLYLIDAQGKIAFKNGRGPFGFKLTELEQSLILLLQEKTFATKSNPIGQ